MELRFVWVGSSLKPAREFYLLGAISAIKRWFRDPLFVEALHKDVNVGSFSYKASQDSKRIDSDDPGG